jgi:hypothetical protein
MNNLEIFELRLTLWFSANCRLFEAIIHTILADRSWHKILADQKIYQFGGMDFLNLRV